MEPTLSQALSSVLGAAVPSAARTALLAAATAATANAGPTGSARPERLAEVIPLRPRRQSVPSSVPERPSAA